ncbi:SPOR domain-containing protein [Chromobacterium sphagni]|uniref:Sporulation protein n=1 Tax=Chromobacterium sphagni TaxID=1903179 RepID=A0A1S1X3M6_9NEIS|nr:SPOR domain-containing protein [Chromobacterium sphagni]OHX13846.1 sporulation protein [Chromobacterium sphagni]OHX20809.1 sporulation protein [Chromobacterium sphagni]
MANRDLKNSPRPSRGRSNSSSSRSGGGGMMAGIIIGLIVGVAVAVGLAMYLNRSPAPFQAKGEHKPDAASQAPTELLAPGTRISDAASATAPTTPPAAQQQPPQATLDSTDTVPLPPPAVAHEAKPKPAAQAKSAKDDQRFDFYKILPGQVDAVTSDAKGNRAAEPSPSTPAKKVYLQLGAFQNQDDADNLKAKLALLGVEAKIQSVNVPDKGMVHRVRVGPLVRQDEVDRIRAQLKQDGINANVVKAE